MRKTIYHYDETGRLRGQSVADESPLEKGVFMVPAYATFDAPPAHNPATEQAMYTPAYWPTGIEKESGGVWRVQAIEQTSTGEGA